MRAAPSGRRWRASCIPLLDVEALDPELRGKLAKWQAEGGDPNFYRLLGRLPDRLTLGKVISVLELPCGEA
jgi:hypothetical protein